MERLTLRLPEELHAKLRWLAYKKRQSLNSILIELLEKSLADVKVPKEDEEK